MADEKILIIEDDPTLLRGLRDNFLFEGYNVSCAADGELGLQMALEDNADIILLDIMLPKVNGYEICRLLRRDAIEAPIIMLTAKGQEADIVMGLDLGADDYVTKPFSIKELLARVAAFLRRSRSQRCACYSFGKFELDLTRRQLLAEGGEVTLTPKEFNLLELLVKRRGRALRRSEILQRVWGHGIFVTDRSVDRCVNTLRSKIEPDPASPIYIKTIREIGYRFDYECAE